MNIAVLYSGGKDSNFVVYNALKEGYKVSLLITIIPESEESMLFHYPNVIHTNIQARCMNIPIIQEREQEMGLLEILRKVKEEYKITHILSGSICSRFQNDRFKALCDELDLKYYAPLWNVSQIEYMHKLIDLGFKILITGVSAYGLDDKWLGKVLDKDLLNKLIRLSKVYGFNPAFEGGEAETFVLDAPHFKDRIIVKDGYICWDGVRGTFTITMLEIERKI